MTDLYLGYPSTDETTWIKKYATPFYIEALENGTTVNLDKIRESVLPEISFLYSFDNKMWNDWDYETGTDVIAGQKLYLKAKTENTTFSLTNSAYFKFSVMRSGGSNFANFNVGGNIMSLVYNDFTNKIDFQDTTKLNKLFNMCQSLQDASNLILPAIKLSNNCYWNMFYNCADLKTTPKLPATKLVKSCYRSMFTECHALTCAPELPAITLAQTCYSTMFQNCTNLSGSVNLPATKLATDCYDLMFNGCTSVTEIHYPKSIENDSTFTSMYGSPWFGATNATIYYDL